MTNRFLHLRNRHVLITSVLLFGLAGCASLPPRAKTQDLKSIAGKWEGYANTPIGNWTTTDNIREDGSNEWTAGSDKGTSTLSVTGDVIRWKSSSGRSGTVVLHEGEGQRVLVWMVDGCPRCDARSTPTK
jgi:hypothetical protein